MSRVALYAGRGADLLRCARRARARGDRVVTAGTEESGSGSVFGDLVTRMGSGEIDAILAILAPEGPVLRLGAQAEGAAPGLKRSRPSVIAPPPAGATAAIYTRCASTQQGSSAIADRTASCQSYAEGQGWNVAGTYSDVGRSGLRAQGRPGLAELMAAAERGAFQVLVVDNLSRLARNAAVLRELFRELVGLGVAICSVEGEAPQEPRPPAQIASIYARYSQGAEIEDICRGLNDEPPAAPGGEDRS